MHNMRARVSPAALERRVVIQDYHDGVKHLTHRDPSTLAAFRSIEQAELHMDHLRLSRQWAAVRMGADDLADLLGWVATREGMSAVAMIEVDAAGSTTVAVRPILLDAVAAIPGGAA